MEYCYHLVNVIKRAWFQSDHMSQLAKGTLFICVVNVFVK